MELEWIMKEEKALVFCNTQYERDICRRAHSKQRLAHRDAIEQQYFLPGRLHISI